MRIDMKMSAIALSYLVAGMVTQEASAAGFLHFPRCPDGIVDKRCECRAYVATRFNICHTGQHCLRNAFHGMCW